MQVGDLVRILDGGSGLVYDGEIPPDALGIVVEEPGSPVFQKGGAFPQMWVQWNGRWDWDSMLVEDLEIISASR